VDYYSGLEDSSSEGESDEESEDDPLNDIEYEEDEIPVTGFAVASSRRNQEFHELFTTIPAEDYLIEGASFLLHPVLRTALTWR